MGNFGFVEFESSRVCLQLALTSSIADSGSDRTLSRSSASSAGKNSWEKGVRAQIEVIAPDVTYSLIVEEARDARRRDVYDPSVSSPPSLLALNGSA